jgi:hypothetical protein
MKLEYLGTQKFKMLLPHEVDIESGTIIDTNDKELQKQLQELGFSKITKEGDK